MSLPGPGQPRTAADPADQRRGAGALACSSVSVCGGESATSKQPPALQCRSSRDVPAAQHARPRMRGLRAEEGERTRDAWSELRPTPNSSG